MFTGDFFYASKNLYGKFALYRSLYIHHWLVGWLSRISCRGRHSPVTCYCIYCAAIRYYEGNKKALKGLEFSRCLIYYPHYKSYTMKSMKFLFVTTSHDKMGDTAGKTGVWLEELAAPYYVFKEIGADIMLASPKGGLVPLDPKSLAIILATRSTKRFLKDVEAMDILSKSMVLSAIKADDFDGVFLTGGHGSLWDIADNKILKSLLETFLRMGKPIGAVCHGVAGLVSLQNDKGEYFVKGRQLTGYSNSEEESSGLTLVVPFLLETKLLSAGALYTRGPDYVSHVVADGNIVTGQNPASSEEVAKKIAALAQLKKITGTIPVH